jgi:hypothetical protein
VLQVVGVLGARIGMLWGHYLKEKEKEVGRRKIKKRGYTRKRREGERGRGEKKEEDCSRTV